MITHELIERIEGEAQLDFSLDDAGRVLDASTRFVHFRGMERILEGRDALDALAITPRVCGICGHSHLLATVSMLENLYAHAGQSVTPTPKAHAIRRITQQSEVLQNHLKWLYLVMFPQSRALLGIEAPSPMQALSICAKINSMTALLSGQWPHSSYAMVGGVTCDPTYSEIMRALALLEEVAAFVTHHVVSMPLEAWEEHIVERPIVEGALGALLGDFEALGLLESGHSHGRLLALPARMVDGVRYDASLDAIEEEAHSDEGTYAKRVRYAGKFYETGPLARTVLGNRAGINALWRRYGDSAPLRIVARIDEIVSILGEIRALLQTLDLSQSSCVEVAPFGSISGTGVGIVEAPRGLLLHRATLQRGIITRYDIITPTQWNLGNGTATHSGIAQQAMRGATSSAKAALIFRTFDVCSVCTTH
ncbi:MAG: hypothetical protein KU37_02355 [Sulfuricurvum sp. PC08-66]|nr:MAG: hypothetical protein KU37_02355 [Sulfuricurvum sp. PC08-66]